MFMKLESINFTLEKLSKMQMLNKGKKKLAVTTKKQLDNDKVVKKTCIFRRKINAVFSIMGLSTEFYGVPTNLNFQYLTNWSKRIEVLPILFFQYT